MLRAFLADTMTGLVGEPIDVPGCSWTVTVNSCTLNTTRGTVAGDEEMTGLTLPWSCVPGKDGPAKARALAPLRRSLLLCWESDDSMLPVLVGAIGNRTDGWLDTRFDLVSTLELLSYRVLCQEGAFGADVTTSQTSSGATVTTKATHGGYQYQNLSQRAIACAVVRECTKGKPGGTLPIDLPYLGEECVHYAADGTPNQNFWRSYPNHNVANDSAKDIIEKLCSTSYGPDIQLRPYMADGTHYRLRLEAGSDWEPCLGQSGLVRTLACFPGGGSLQDVRVSHDFPAQRVYQTGSGQDEAMNCHLSEDLSLVTQADPWPLVEIVRQDTNLSGSSIAAHADATLAAKSRPIMQVEGYVDANDPHAFAPGEVWPGELVDVSIDGFPSVPDGTYRMRLMEMSGDQSSRVKLTFDLMEDPLW